MRNALALAAALLILPAVGGAQQRKNSPEPPRADTSQPAPTTLTLDDAIRMALDHNHALLAARSTILQNQAQEITANLRPNPTLSGTRSFFRYSSRASSVSTTWTIRRSSISASGISSSGERRGSTGFRRPGMQPR